MRRDPLTELLQRVAPRAPRSRIAGRETASDARTTRDEGPLHRRHFTARTLDTLRGRAIDCELHRVDSRKFAAEDVHSTQYVAIREALDGKADEWQHQVSDEEYTTTRSLNP